jgi:hypothetical protein
MTSPSSQLAKKLQDWKEQGKSCAAVIIGLDKKQLAEVFLVHWTAKERRIRALRSFALLWGLAALSILIPIAHFFLVPLFFICGLIIPFATYRKESVVLGGIGKCPWCTEEFEVAATADRWPLQDICTACHRHVRIEKTT